MPYEGSLVGPDAKEHLFIADGHRHETIQFILRPPLCKEGVGEDDQAEPAASDAAVDLLAQTVADSQFSNSSHQTDSPRSWRAIARGRTTASLSSAAWDRKTSNSRFSSVISAMLLAISSRSDRRSLIGGGVESPSG